MIYRDKPRNKREGTIGDWRYVVVDLLKPRPMTLAQLAGALGDPLGSTTLRLRRFPRTFKFPSEGHVKPHCIVDLSEGLRWHNPIQDKVAV